MASVEENWHTSGDSDIATRNDIVMVSGGFVLKFIANGEYLCGSRIIVM